MGSVDYLFASGGLDWSWYEPRYEILRTEKHSILGGYKVKVFVFRGGLVLCEIFKKCGRKAVAHSETECYSGFSGEREIVRDAERYVIDNYLEVA